MNLVNAMTSIEDRNFFHHSGVDFLRVFKAGYDDLRGHHLAGASTLSMQFAGGYFLDRRDRTWHRKIPEVIITLELEQRFTKKEIFEMYMNQVNFGQRGSFSINGIGEAALAYFDKGHQTIFRCRKRPCWRGSSMVPASIRRIVIPKSAGRVVTWF